MKRLEFGVAHLGKRRLSLSRMRAVCGPTVSAPPSLSHLDSAGKIDPGLLITHRFKLDHILDAYETFAHAADTRALKVIIEA